MGAENRTYGRHIVQSPPDFSFCAGCGSCEVVCSLTKDGLTGPCYNRIFMEMDTRKMFFTIHSCMHCSDHPCADACPKKGEAMIVGADGIARIDGDKCIGCGKCRKACVFDPPRINLVKSADKKQRKAKKCDMCSDRPNGPACVEWCPVRCLRTQGTQGDGSLVFGYADKAQRDAQGAQGDGSPVLAQGAQGDGSPVFGYAGKIARINLTDKSFEIIPTSKYAPEYIGGRAVCNRIFWEEVPPGTKAFDPGNKIIYMTGPTTGTGIPTGGRSEMTGISPNSLPEMYSWSGIGGYVGAELKFAGYDGFIIEGRSEEQIYVLIDNDKITFHSAEPLWGLLVHATQRKLEELHGKDIKSMVIGPAGENLMRNASITTSNDNVAAKAGFGAVFGSKNLKAISIRGTGVVRAADIAKLFELRLKMGHPYMRPSPLLRQETHGMDGNEIPVDGGWLRGQVACSHGCNQHCNRLMIDVKSAFSGERINQVEKCVGIFAYGFKEDCSWLPIQNFETQKNHFLACKLLSCEMPEPDPSDPHFGELFNKVRGDLVNFWKPDFDKGSVMMDMCNEYGIDKWDVIVWYFTWLSMAKKEGLLDGMDFGMEVDVENEEFVKHFLDMITYRKGEYGPVFAEGMARAVRTLGKEKFGDTTYNGRYSQMTGERLDLPVSLESAWGHCFHWQGRGFEGSINKVGWLATSLSLMLSSRDTQTNAHHHDTWQHYLEIKDDPCRSPLLVDGVIMNENKADVKDSVTCCEFLSPDLFWHEMESEALNAATGLSVTPDELEHAAVRSRLLFRAILIRNYGRTRDIEVGAIFPSMQIPDTFGETVTWEDWNDLVDIYYSKRGWDIKTGWPTRATYEKYGLKDVADELELIEKLP